MLELSRVEARLAGLAAHWCRRAREGSVDTRAAGMSMLRSHAAAQGVATGAGLRDGVNGDPLRRCLRARARRWDSDVATGWTATIRGRRNWTDDGRLGMAWRFVSQKVSVHLRHGVRWRLRSKHFGKTGGGGCGGKLTSGPGILGLGSAWVVCVCVCDGNSVFHLSPSLPAVRKFRRICASGGTALQ